MLQVEEAGERVEQTLGQAFKGSLRLQPAA